MDTSRTAIGISGVGDSQSGQTNSQVQFRLQSIHSNQTISLTAYSLSRLTAELPTFSSDHLSWPHLEQIELADPDFLTPAPVDLLIGADVFGQLILPDVLKGGPGDPIAQRTLFGWIVSGPTDSRPSPAGLSHHVAVEEDRLDDLLTKFWVQEEVPSTEDADLSAEELECERHFQQTHSRDSSGRYIVRLPLTASPESLGSSHRSALGCFSRLSSRLAHDPLYRRLYTDFLQDYEALGHMKAVCPSHGSSARPRDPAASAPAEMTLAPGAQAPGGLRVSVGQRSTPVPPGGEYYLPHHGVLRESSETTKLRVVFNGSCKTSSGKSLNDIMHTGAKLQRDISDVLLWARQHKLIFMTDISKMFRQIKVHSDDWPLQQILWTDSQGQLNTYQLTTVTYGTRSAPFLAIRVLLQLVKDEGHQFPLAIAPLTHGRYVDDICGGADTLDDLLKTARQVEGLCSAGGFPLAKWHSNSVELQRTYSPNDVSTEQREFEPSPTKILGLSWNSRSDSFVFSANTPEPTTISKRTILSEIAQLFDPLGLLAPVVIRAKILLQGLWIEKLGWDDKVSPQTAHQWNQFREELAQLAQITIPRWLGLMKNSKVEIHGFSDASQMAMAAVVYLKVVNGDDEPRISLVCSKTKVAPLKRLTIPRLELSAAVLLAKLVRYVQDQLNLMDAPVFLWTDSSVTHTWISSHPSRWKEYVRNRVMLIQELSQTAQWRYVPGKENPADCASRGLSAAQLSKHKLWWNGPSWLAQTDVSWPAQEPPPQISAELEEKPGMLFHVHARQPELWDLLDRYSSIDKLLRVTAVCQRFIARLRKVPNSSLRTPLTPGDIETARLYWVKATQAAHFPDELRTISRGQQLGTSHPMSRLTAFIDRQGTLRVGGRLRHAQLEPDSIHQAILPKDSRLAQLLITDAHLKTLHGGTQLTLAQLRRAYWILGGRAPVRSLLHKCVQCARQRGVRAQQLMGQLPTARLTPARAFLNTGVDYAGPVSLRSWKGRGHKSYKGWLVIFVCMATSAVHLEVVSDYSADGFLAAYRRFVSRRGLCRVLYSDCGTTFLGADKELRKTFSAGTKESRQLAQLLLNDGTQWCFNPPGAPHFGGKWEAAVKSVKFHLKRTIGEALLTFEELTTLLAQIEAVLNSRPLEPLSDDPDDCSALTPGHFLIGQALSTVPEPSLDHLNVDRLTRWQLIQQKLQEFWKRWSTGYLQQLQSISKWQRPSHDIKIGSMVLLSDERMPPTKWPLARVTTLHPGSDGLTRVVTLKTATGSLTRPVVKLVPLPV